jgi:hypothetical protein
MSANTNWSSVFNNAGSNSSQSNSNNNVPTPQATPQNAIAVMQNPNASPDDQMAAANWLRQSVYGNQQQQQGGVPGILGQMSGASPASAQSILRLVQGRGSSLGAGASAGNGDTQSGISAQASNTLPNTSTLSSVLSNPIVGALAGGALGALGGGGKGAIAGAIGGPMLGSNVAQALNAAQANDPTTNLAALSAKYLPLLAASYAGSFYKNPTAPTSYGRPASQNETLAEVTPKTPASGGHWYTYGTLPDETAQGHAAGGAIADPMANASPLSAGVAAPSVTGDSYIHGKGSGTEDLVPARLANQEFVIPADVVASLGDGSSDEGANKLYNLMDNVRKHKAPALAKGKLPPDAKSPERYMKGKK